MDNTFHLPSKARNLAIVAMAIGGIMGAASFFVHGDNPTRVWSSFLVNNFFFLALGLFGTVFMAISIVSHAGWMVVMKRILEAMGQYIPIGLIGMLLIGVFGLEHIYEWAIPELVAHDEILQVKEPFLNRTFFLGLVVFALVVYTLFTFALRKQSLMEDVEGGIKRWQNSHRLSAFFMVLFAFSFCAIAFQWLMSIEPHWYSTIYAVYVFAGMLVLGLCFVNLSSLYMRGQGAFDQFREDHMHDISKFTFGFSIFWAYIWISQFLLIWYANVPEETPYYLLRWGEVEGEPNWKPLFFLNLFINFVSPFLIFMTRGAKRKVQVVLVVCALLIVGKWIDWYLLIVPGANKFANHLAHIKGTAHVHPGFGLPEIGFFLFFGGLFILVVSRALSQAPLIAKNHPYMPESLSHHI